MTSNHTPGPWFYRYSLDPHYDDWGQVRAPDGYVLCQVRDPRASDTETLSKHRANGTDPWAANAHLIAAAPDLYRALEATLEMLPIGFVATGRPGGAVDRNAALSAVRKNALAALAKADGEPS